VATGIILEGARAGHGGMRGQGMEKEEQGPGRLWLYAKRKERNCRGQWGEADGDV